jgi:UDP-N-acetylmuramoylalanine--D-glutamate ligase
MNNSLEFQNKKVAVLGLGIEGIALAKFLELKCQSITLLDRATEEELMARDDAKALLELIQNNNFEKKLGPDYMDNLSDYEVVYRTPGIPYLDPKIQEAIKRGALIGSQIKLFFDLCSCPIIGVTGTKGKGTTSSLIFEMLKAGGKNTFFAGNIGHPAINLIDELKSTDIVVLELSSFQTQDLTKSPHIAVVINITVDHLNYHKDEREYVAAKESIVKYQRSDDYAIINQDYLTSFEFASLTPGKIYFFSGRNSVDEGAFVRKSQIGSFGEVVLRTEAKDEVICRGDEVNLVGPHNLENIAAASLAAFISGVSIQDISKTAKEFSPLPHRIEFVREIEGVKFYNDSYATNPDPTMAAIRSFTEEKILILGGSSKGAAFDELAREIVISNVAGVVLIGDEALNIRNSLVKLNFDGEIFDAGKDFSLAVRNARKMAKSGDVVIFSPSCASFDMFKNYKDRGNKFKEVVAGLK